MNIERVPLSSLRQDPANARRHSRRNVDTIMASLDRFGQQRPIVIDAENRILAGNGTYQAARELEWTEIDVTRTKLAGDEARAYALADNRTAELAEWDQEELRLALRDLEGRKFDLAKLGWTPGELAQLPRWNPAAAEPDPSEPVLADPVAKLGDIWKCGEHRVMCGDATDIVNVSHLADGQAPAQVVFTDPPYGVDYQGAAGSIKNDAEAGNKLVALLRAAFAHAMKIVLRSAAWYIWHASATREDCAHAMKISGLVERQYLIWVKPTFVLGHADYHWSHEPCFYAHQAGESPDFFGNRAQSTVWRVGIRAPDAHAAALGKGVVLNDGEASQIHVTRRLPRTKLPAFRVPKGTFITIAEHPGDSTTWEISRTEQSAHPTQKPSELAEIALRNSSRPGDTVLDPFLGGGCTLLGAEKTGRRCLGMELDPRWVDVSVVRWQRLTGQHAKNLKRPSVQLGEGSAS